MQNFVASDKTKTAQLAYLTISILPLKESHLNFSVYRMQNRSANEENIDYTMKKKK